MIFYRTLTSGLFVLLVLVPLIDCLTYPSASRNTSVVENYHGTMVSDPYRWMENKDAEATKTYVTAQRDLSKSYLEKCRFRDQIRQRLNDFWNYKRSDPPQRRGNNYFQYVHEGLQNLRVLYIQDALEGSNINRRVFLDPNTFSSDGTIDLSSTQSFSSDGEIFAYGTSTNGSDWRKVYFRNVSSNQNLGDVLVKVKATSLAWKGNEGIFYGHYPDFEGEPEGSDTGRTINQKISYHKLGTSQSEDVIVVDFPDQPQNSIANMVVTNNYLIFTPSAGSSGNNTIYYVDLSVNETSTWVKRALVDTYNAEYRFFTEMNGTFYFFTNLNAPRYRIVGIQLSSPQPESWVTLIPDNGQNVLASALTINREYILLNYVANVSSKLVLRSLIQGNTLEKEFEIEMGTAMSFGVVATQVFIKVQSFLVPNRIYKLDLATPLAELKLEIFEDAEIPGFDPTLYTVKQVTYPSKDGTQIPMYIVHKKDLVLDGSSPAMLFGYGGFNVNILPEFSVRRIVFMQSFDGVIAIANMRGGGEFGHSWHEGGSLLNKQNVFDDFQAGAEYLIAERYTTAQKMIIEGRSNGGLLVGTCVNQRPELYGAVIAAVGVMDMLRYHLFTGGHTWISEYGSSADPIHFQNIFNYSPLHNLRLPGDFRIQYPAILVTTADNDDRVVPSHSYKYAAELQFTVGRNETQTQPFLLRVETAAGHGSAGSWPTSKLVEEHVDILSFLTESLDLAFEGQKSTAGDGTINVRYTSILLITGLLNFFWYFCRMI